MPVGVALFSRLLCSLNIQYSDRTEFENGRQARISFAVWLCKWKANDDLRVTCLRYIYIHISNTNEDKTHCKDHLYFDQIVGLPQGEDRQVGRNIGGLYNVSYLHLCLIYCFMRKTSTHIGCLWEFIYIYILFFYAVPDFKWYSSPYLLQQYIIYIYNCRQYCFGLLGLISAVLMLRWRWSFKSHLEFPTNVVTQSCQSAQTRVL